MGIRHRIKGKYQFSPNLNNANPPATAMSWYKQVHAFTEKNYSRLSSIQPTINKAQDSLSVLIKTLEGTPNSDTTIMAAQEIIDTLDDIYAAEEVATDNILALIPKMELQASNGSVYTQRDFGAKW